jgi:electron transport complex protein RnfG
VEEKMNNKVNISGLVLAMALISGTATALMAAVWLATTEPIAAARQQKTNAALSQVLPEFDNQPAEDRVTCGGVTFYIARKGGQITGFAGEAVSTKGYGGGVTVLAGLTLDGTLTTVLVTRQNETPGLGTVVCDRNRQKTLSGLLSGHRETGLPPNRILDQFRGMQAAVGEAPWSVKKDGGTLDAITGATVSSRAVADAVFSIASSFAQNSSSLVTNH